MPDSPTPSELLAAFLLADEERARAAGARMSVRRMWTNAVRLATLWRVLPRLDARVRELRVELPTAAREELHEGMAAAAAQSAMVCHRTAQALEALAAAGIDAAAFKGVAAIASIYGTPGARMLSDADLLIRPEDFKTTVATLTGLGFRPDITIGLDDWLDVLEERVYPVHDFLDLVDDDGVKIDLHWRLSTPVPEGLAIADVLARSRTAMLSRRQVRIVAVEDAVLFTAHHAVRDSLVARSAVKDLLDVAGWVSGVACACDLGVVLDRAGACGLDVSVGAALEILGRYTPDGSLAHLAEHGRGRLDRVNRRSAERLADLFFLQLERGNASELLVGLSGMTPALLKRFFVSRLRSLASATYRRHKYTGQPPPGAGHQLRAFVRDLFGLTPRRLAIYRALSRETRRYVGEGGAEQATSGDTAEHVP